ncbi:MAG: SAM-dependent DNA methyltransferase, partial [Chloroflexi bacterium]|nr:SAM-dependent DNA methyltransferase [Chloroflexota bacterium]
MGAKNCEFAPEHIAEITRLLLEMEEATDAEGKPISKLFNNADFGYYKATVERPLRLKAQFTPERIAPLRYMSQMEPLMAWAYTRWGAEIVTTLDQHKEALIAFAEAQDMQLTAGRKRKLLNQKGWQTAYQLWQAADRLMADLGQAVADDLNLLAAQVDAANKRLQLGLSSGDKKKILNA